MSTLTVATLNLKKGELRWDERAPLLVRQLVALRPDIIGFQEIHLPIDQGNWICQRANELLSLVGAPLYRIHHMANPRENAALEALGIMTHLPVLRHEGFDYLIRNRVAHFISVETPDGRSLDFWNTHFHHEQDDAGHKMRQEQAEKLSAWINGRSHGSPVVLVGDFNCVPGTRPVRTIGAHLTSVFDALGREAPMTCPTPLEPKPYPGHWAIDHIFASPAVRVLDASPAFDKPDAKDRNLYASDHFGLSATVEVR